MRRSRGRARHTVPCGSEDAVSPVIGMVLILAISVLGIVAVTNWGLPAILAMQQNVEMRSVLNEFGALDASMQKLIAGTTGQTTFKWQPSIGKGAVDVSPTGDRWLIATDTASGTRLVWEKADDADNEIRIAGTIAGDPTVRIHAWRWIEGVATELRVTTGNTCTVWDGQFGPLGSGRDFTLRTNETTCQAVNLDNAVISFSIRKPPGAGNEAAPFAEAYLADVGHVRWNNLAGSPQQVTHSNGAIFSGPVDNFVSQSSLAVSPVRAFKNSAGTESVGLFARLVKLNGTASFSGVQDGARTSVFLDFAGTWTMGSIADTDRVSIYVFGDLQNVTYTELQRTGYGFTLQTTNTAPGSAMPASYVAYTEPTKPFRFNTAYTFVEVQR